MNIYLILQMAADAMPDRIAVSHGTQNLTYAELAQRARQLAAATPAQHRIGF